MPPEHVREPVPGEPRPAAGAGPPAAGLTARIVLTALGAAGIIVGAFLPWVGDEFGNLDGVDISWKVYWSNQPTVDVPFYESAGFVAILIGLVAILGLAPRTGVLSSVAGALGIVAFVLVVISLYRVEGPNGADISNVRLGLWLVLAGGVAALVGGFLGARPRAVTTTSTGPAGTSTTTTYSE